MDTRVLAGQLHSVINGMLQRGRELGLVQSSCNFARLGRADRADFGTHWDTFLELPGLVVTLQCL